MVFRAKRNFALWGQVVETTPHIFFRFHRAAHTAAWAGNHLTKTGQTASFLCRSMLFSFLWAGNNLHTINY